MNFSLLHSTSQTLNSTTTVSLEWNELKEVCYCLQVFVSDPRKQIFFNQPFLSVVPTLIENHITLYQYIHSNSACNHIIHSIEAIPSQNDIHLESNISTLF